VSYLVAVKLLYVIRRIHHVVHDTKSALDRQNLSRFKIVYSLRLANQLRLSSVSSV
jgi:hypothetical protein